MKAFFKTILFLLVLTGIAHAQTQNQTQNQASAQVSAPTGTSTTVLKNKKFEDTREITDTKMRADLGSLSRYSFKFDLSYYGPAMGTPWEKNLPNPDGVVRDSTTKIKGNISARYRLDSNSSLFLASGLSTLYPLHGVGRTDVNTPQVGYDMFHRLGDVQMRNALSVSAVTVPTYQAVGMAAGLNYVGSLIFEFGTSGFFAGTDLLFFYNIFNREYNPTTDRGTPRYTGIFSPSLKYNFSDRWNVNTNLGFAFWNPRSLENEWALWPQAVTQKLAVGYAFTKAVYVSPYLNFYPGKIATDTTTMNISTVFSVL